MNSIRSSSCICCSYVKHEIRIVTPQRLRKAPNRARRRPPPPFSSSQPQVPNIRTTLKHCLEGLAVGIGVDRIRRRLHGGTTVILAYHNVVPDELAGMGDASLHIPLGRFRQHLDALTATHEVRSLEEVLARRQHLDEEASLAAITFDDAYRGTLEVALPELQARKLPATLFVAPAILGDRTLWWDAISEPSLGGPRPEVRTRILEEGEGKEESARLVVPDALWQEMPSLMRTVTEAELLELEAGFDLSIGSHTWSHPSLPRLSKEELSEELLQPREWLRTRFPERYLDVLSYPYGHSSGEIRRAVEEAGYHAGLALRGNRLQNPEEGTGYAVPRLNVPSGLSRNGLKLRLGKRDR